MNSYSFQKLTRKWHRYLGVLLGLQFLLWTFGGLYFSWTDIKTIRGEDIKADKSILSLPSNAGSLTSLRDSINLQISGAKYDQLHIVDILGKMYYQVHIKSPVAQVVLYDVQSMKQRPSLTKDEAIQIATNSLKAPSKVLETSYLTETNSHHEYREKPLPAYAVTFDKPNNTTVYVSASLGSVQSYRNNQWRLFDFLWMMHTMDYRERDNFNNMLLRIFSVFGLVTLLSGFTLFFLTAKFFSKK